ncbi:MAG: hypothetical protein Q7S53_02790 [bacterium]|nr:hypothetical protein [bacterium]
MVEPKYTTEVGNYIIVSLTGMHRTYIAEVTKAEPLRLKVMERGPLAHLKEEDFIVQQDETIQLQEGNSDLLFKIMGERKLYTGLESMNVIDGKLHEILPKMPVA